MIGRLLGGRYAIVESVDSGGMAYIYKAICKKTDRTVAVKVLKEEFSNSEEYVSRFKKEAEAAFSLEHRNIVHVTDIGCDNGTYYMVMEFVEGQSLKALIEEKGRISEKEAIGYAMQVCDALEAAHSEGIIHRDIKPQNILLAADGQIKITDFGIATSVSSAEPKDGQVMGSVYYISPEQARGEKTDCRTDIYSLGIVLYEMLTGTLPHTGEKTVAVALKHINEKLTPPIVKNESLSMSVNNIVIKAMSKSPRSRYRSAEALRADLNRALNEPDGEFVDIPKSLPDEARVALRGKHKIWKICILVSLVLIAGAAVYLGFRLFGQPVFDMVEVSDTTELSADAAQSLLENDGLIVNIVLEPSETITEGMVIAQSISEGIQVSKGSSITLTVSSGPLVPVMPDVVGLSEYEAQAKFASMGLGTADVTYEARDDVPQGQVISQMPEADTEITSDVLVSIVVAGEPALNGSPMPSVKGMMLDQAMSLLKGTGFMNCFVYEQDSELEDGIVKDQTPAEGVQTPYSGEVVLYVSRFASRAYSGVFDQTIALTDAGSKLRVVLIDNVNGVDISFVVYEDTTDSSTVHLNVPLTAFTGGNKTVIIFINNVATHTFEVPFG